VREKVRGRRGEGEKRRRGEKESERKGEGEKRRVREKVRGRKGEKGRDLKRLFCSDFSILFL